jgi:hypothetical protein
MSAPRRKYLATPVWLQPRASQRAPASFQAKVIGYPGAKEALRKLKIWGFPEHLLWRQLWGLAWLKKTPSSQNSNWYALPGISSHSLRRFPNQVRRLAKEIELVHAKIRSDKAHSLTMQFLPFFLSTAIPGARIEFRCGADVVRDVGTEIQTIPPALARKLLRTQAELPKLAEVPSLLRLYADYIEAVSRFTAHHASKAPALLNAMMPLELIESAKKFTGKPRANEIAALLDAAYSAVGINKIVDPRNLMMQYSRRVSRKK